MIAFLSLFALDAFEGRFGFWTTVLAFLIHFVPVVALIAALILAWRWEWVGAAVYAAAGLLYVLWTLTVPRPIPPFIGLSWILTTAGPAFIIVGLFLANRLKRCAAK